MSELIPPSETSEPIPIRTGTATADQQPEVVRLGSAKGGWWRQVGWRHLVAWVALFFGLFPILFLISAAINPIGTLSTAQLIPNGASLENFSKLFDRTEYVHWYWNTLLIAVVAGTLSMFISACAAYAYSRFRFKGRRMGLLGLLLIQMFPQFLAIVTLYLMFTTITDYYPRIGFNTPWSLIILYLGGALGVNTWLMKGFLDTVPKDLDESARVDGATHAQIFFGIILPLITPILAVTGLLGFIGYVNEFLIANVFLTDPESKTLAVGLFGLVAGERNNNFGVFAAGAVLAAIPTVVLFQILQRFIVGGLTTGAVKG
jgi:arabinogalactan oligomer / maltooligosaccharide transport system permease protein